MMMTRKGGTCVLTGMTPLSEMNPRASMPMLLSMYEAGDLKLDELVTRRYKLDEINDAIKHLREGCNIRGVIDFTGS